MLSKRLPEKIAKRLRLPLIAAPMLSVSGPDLAIAACKAGVIGSFPLANARSIEGVDAWLKQIETALAETAEKTPEHFPDLAPAPFCPNLIIKRAEMRAELDALVRHRVEMVITSVGSPAEPLGPLHDVGTIVFADVATIHHAEKAIASGVDGLILLTAGAGGQTGWLNPLAFVRATRAMFDGPIVLAGGISDGAALWAAEILGCDLAYMGTKFIATRESLAKESYKEMLVKSRLDDVLLTRAFTGLETNMLRPSIAAAGLDPDNLPVHGAIDIAKDINAAERDKRDAEGPDAKRWKDIWSAGHSVSGVSDVPSVAELVERTEAEYRSALQTT